MFIEVRVDWYAGMYVITIWVPPKLCTDFLVRYVVLLNNTSNHIKNNILYCLYVDVHLIR